MATHWTVGRFLRAGVIGAIAGVAVAVNAAPAAGVQPEAPGRPRPAPPQSQPQQPATDVVQVVSINFPGGTVAEYVETVKRAGSGPQINVLVPTEAAGVTLPPITLRSVSVKTALDALSYAFPHPGVGQEHEFRVQPFGEGSGGATVFAIAYRRVGQPVPGMPHMAPHMARTGGMVGPGMTPDQIQVFSLMEIVSPPAVGEGVQVGVPVEVVLTAVEAALGAGGDGDAGTQVRFHRDSNLLIVRGTAAQISLVQALLGEVRKDVQTRWATVRQESLQESERRYRQQRTEIEIELAEREVAAAERRVEQIRPHVQAATAPDLVDAETHLARKRAQLEVLRLELKRPVTESPSQRSQQGRIGGPPSPAQGLDSSLLTQLVVDLQRRVTELQAEVDRLRATPAPR